jgi:hypothetical protein
VSRLIPKRAWIASAAVTAGLLTTACVPDTTRGRVEHDVAATFSNQYAQSLQRQGKPVERPKIKSIECHSGVNVKVDSGPGGWPCEIKYVGADGKPQDDTFLTLIDALGCYQAFNVDDTKRYHKVIDVQSHKKIDDPAGSFDGCYDVFDDRTNTSKK